MKYISFFSGIEAASVAWSTLGWEPLAFSEIEPFPRAVLNHHFPGVPNHGDITKFDWSFYHGKVDICVGGPPCTAFSLAGLRESLSSEIGKLSLEYAKAIHAINPVWSITENVPGWLSTKDNAFGCMLAALVGADAPLLPSPEPTRKDRSNDLWRWDRKDKKYISKWPREGMVEGPLGRAAWRVLDAQYVRVDGFAGAVPQRRKRVFLVGGFREWADPSAVLFERESLQGNPPPRRKKGKGTAGGLEIGVGSGCLIESQIGLSGEEMHTYENNQFAKFTESDINPTIQRRDHKDSSVLIVFNKLQITSKENRSTVNPNDPSHTINSSGQIYISTQTQIRRLTPTEYERLQGFPDGWTAITYKGKPAKDSPRYKALGNSMAVNVMRWIGQRIDLVDEICSKNFP